MKQKIRPDEEKYNFTNAYYTLQELQKFLIKNEFDAVDALAKMAEASEKINEIIKAIVLA